MCHMQIDLIHTLGCVPTTQQEVRAAMNASETGVWDRRRRGAFARVPSGVFYPVEKRLLRYSTTYNTVVGLSRLFFACCWAAINPLCYACVPCIAVAYVTAEDISPVPRRAPAAAGRVYLSISCVSVGALAESSELVMFCFRILTLPPEISFWPIL